MVVPWPTMYASEDLSGCAEYARLLQHRGDWPAGSADDKMEAALKRDRDYYWSEAAPVDTSFAALGCTDVTSCGPIPFLFSGLQVSTPSHLQAPGKGFWSTAAPSDAGRGASKIAGWWESDMHNDICEMDEPF
ncbi:hypothetical protein MCOR06_008844 [Pyricularia oryzae]|nr:hypothetical protein MCOR06_008844 [Pyricularia oryzae]